MNAHGALLELAGRHGIERGYHDIWGTWHDLTQATASAVLRAMGVACDDEAQCAESLRVVDQVAWRQLAPPVLVSRDDERCALSLSVRANDEANVVRWSIVCEDGGRRDGENAVHDLEVLGEATLDAPSDASSVDPAGAITVRRRCLLLPEDLPHGYHHLKVTLAGQEVQVRVIRTPSRCVGVGDTRRWGLSVQLYAMRSAHNWGIGDFEDLRSALGVMAKRGAGFVGVNPLHALHLNLPSHSSPYSPSSREFTNALYLRIEAMDDFAESEAAQSHVRSAAFQARLHALRDSALVDYPGVSACKRELFELLFEHFERTQIARDTGRARDFARYRDSKGDALRCHALFEALHESMSHDERHPWPQRYATPDAEAVVRFADTHLRRIAFFEYLQWQCDIQLDRCRSTARELGMSIGLYLDLAVGADGHGADVWGDADSYARAISVGAPPDDFAPQGQVWGLPPWRPQALRAAAFEPFVRCLRANMRAAGALRIDHVLGLLRLFWVPEGGTAADGAYVHYPVDELLAITALESTRAGCAVVGEDLGTVPDAMRTALARFGVMSYRVFWFEKHWHGDHSYCLPHEYPGEALVSVTTHDLPTSRGFWIGSDLEIRHALGLFSSEAFEASQRQTRELDRARIVHALREQGLWSHEGVADDEPPPRALVEAIHRYAARSACAMFSVQIEDALGVMDATNVPGTVDEQPNWRRRLPVCVEDWDAHDGFDALCKAISAER